MSTVTEPKTAAEDHVYLMTRQSFDDYLDFMESYPVNAADLDRKEVADAWRTANERMKRLRIGEAGFADNPPVAPLPAEMQPLLEEVYADPIFVQAFADTPYEIGMVELDRLVISQKLVSIVHVKRLKEEFGPEPTPEQILRFCLPYEHRQVGHRVGRIGDHEYAFISDSNDLRFLGAVMLRPEQVVDYKPTGPIAGVIGLVVGYGSNYLNAIAIEGRLLLNNGNHRVCALRDLGVTHVPCVIQKISGREELDAVAPGAVRRNPDFFLKSPRPPVLKDFFDAKLCRVVPLAMTTKQVRVSYSVEQMEMP